MSAAAAGKTSAAATPASAARFANSSIVIILALKVRRTRQPVFDFVRDNEPQRLSPT
jgi:hypothetical protein